MKENMKRLNAKWPGSDLKAGLRRKPLARIKTNIDYCILSSEVIILKLDVQTHLWTLEVTLQTLSWIKRVYKQL